MQTDIVEKIIHLPITERVEIIEVLSRSVRLDLRELNDKSPTNTSSNNEKRDAIRRLRGVAKIEGQPAPDDREVRDEYHRYLDEKYK